MALVVYDPYKFDIPLNQETKLKYHISMYKKQNKTKKIGKNSTKNVNMNTQWTRFPNL